jgi:hypothetical protein
MGGREPAMNALAAKLKGVSLAAAANARYKAWTLEREAAAIRRRYANAIKRRGLVVPQGVEFAAALRRRVAERAARLRWPKAAGDLHTFLIYPHHNWEAVLPVALQRFGPVSQFEWRSRGFDEAAADWLSRRDAMNRDLLQAFNAANRERPVDVVVGYVSGFTVAPDVLLEMAQHGAVITNFCFDDKIYWPGRIKGGRHTSPAAIASAVDLNLTSDPAAAVRYFLHGGLSRFHPEAADPAWYAPLAVPFEYDVSFVGAAYGWRPRLIEGLRAHGISVACFGKGWPAGAVSNEEMNGLYARSRINLGCGGIGFSHKLLCLKGRDFEVPMSGALYLTQDNPELTLVFDVGAEIMTYRGIDDCARTIRALLNDPERAARIRRAARARCLADHTYEARWAGVFHALGALESAPAGVRP